MSVSPRKKTINLVAMQEPLQRLARTLLAAAAFKSCISLTFSCATNSDCLLLGACDVEGVCRCRQGFTGTECGQLDFDVAPNHLGYQNSSASTWGGLPVRVNGEWHMYVSMMLGDCPLGTFNNNSEIVHLVSASGWQGPYSYADTVVKNFAHNAAPRMLPDGSIGVWFIGYDGAVDTIRCPHGVAPNDYVWPDWSGKQIAIARSPPGQPTGQVHRCFVLWLTLALASAV
jgi:hypothetical protein